MGMRLCHELKRGKITRCVRVEDDNFSSNLTN
jgi:hypothetical protein